MISTIRRVLGLPLLLRARRLARAFHDQTRHARTVQEHLLLTRIAQQRDTQFGRDHHFQEIRSVADYRKHVPVAGYDRLEPYIDKVRRGNTGALFAPGTSVLMFALTSGTTNQPKTIPLTRQSLNDYREGWLIWGIQAFDAHPGMLSAGLRPMLQIASDWRESFTPAGIPCGAITGLTASMQSRLVRSVYCMPYIASRIKDIRSKYYVALRLSAHLDLGTIIAANPATILTMVRLGDAEKETLIRDFRDGTIAAKWQIPDEVRQALRSRCRPRPAAAACLESIVNRTGRLLPRDYWPNLEFLSNWMGGTMRAYLRNYPEYFGETPVRDVGLIASEGRMTIPIEDGTPAGILDIRHNYFEFIPHDQADSPQPDTVAAADLIEGKQYFIVLSTAGGLYRYAIHDLVRCTGFHGEAPIIEFLNKGAHFSSLTGEKLSEHQVISAVQAAQSRLGLCLNSYLLAPEWGDPPGYLLLVETGDLSDEATANRLAEVVDELLCANNMEYASKRETRRLGPVRTMRVVEGSWSEFQKRRLARGGGTVEQYKQPHLIPDLNAVSWFQFPDHVSR